MTVVVVFVVAIAMYFMFCRIPVTKNDYYRFKLTDGRELVAKAPEGSKIVNPVKIGNSYYYWSSVVVNSENHFVPDYVNEVAK